MQFGQRSQNSSPHKPHHLRTQPLPDTGTDTVDAGAAPSSPARLEAEAAFAAPRPQARPMCPPQVSVRRARRAGQPTAIRHDEAPLEDAQPRSKTPRVFRVDALPSAEPVLSSSNMITTPPGDRSETAPAWPKRRLANDKRPGPVLRVVQAPLARAQHRSAEPKSETLLAALAGIDPVLQAIRRAQSFIFIDERFARPWRQLSQRAGKLLAELQARQRQTPAK